MKDATRVPDVCMSNITKRNGSYKHNRFLCNSVPASHSMQPSMLAVPTPLVVDVPAGQSLGGTAQEALGDGHC